VVLRTVSHVRLADINMRQEKRNVSIVKWDDRLILQAITKQSAHYVLWAQQRHVWAVQNVRIVVLVGMVLAAKNANLANIVNLLWTIRRHVSSAELEDFKRKVVKQAAYHVHRENIKHYVDKQHVQCVK
tara:strand:- start:698 stop:1084 length:387 start_codon:yes stop_codon:yes gene_type:complete